VLFVSLEDHPQHAKVTFGSTFSTCAPHAPPLPLRRGDGRLAAMQGQVLAPPTPVAQLQSFEAIQPTDTLRVHQPALAPQQDVEPLIAKARPRVG
jgi:hypothetical protein